MMKQVKREELVEGQKYWIEGKFLLDTGYLHSSLKFDLGDSEFRYLDDTVTIALVEEDKAEEAPKYVKNIIKKLYELDEYTRVVWLSRIMDEFGVEIRTEAYREGFQQGKFEGALEREKVKLTTEQAERFEKAKENTESLYYFISYFTREKEELMARAWLDGYEIEEPKEPLYWVRKNSGSSLLVKDTQGIITESTGMSIDFQVSRKSKFTFTEKEIKDYDERYWAFAVSVEE